jgi:hypothetical protein
VDGTSIERWHFDQRPDFDCTRSSGPAAALAFVLHYELRPDFDFDCTRSSGPPAALAFVLFRPLTDPRSHISLYMPTLASAPTHHTCSGPPGVQSITGAYSGVPVVLRPACKSLPGARSDFGIFAMSYELLSCPHLIRSPPRSNQEPGTSQDRPSSCGYI